ncbi:NADPH:quinone reductase [Prauserella marina]|uniref:NADPH2:quinone reductase n=1 Tax=Prauserella marina TaxID=530584 RepID=A0A222VVY1_9PSEU|nr:zinc-binding dehydrogenase [Prauserella marina]ASR37881.1 NADPH:quinone reductase [Prauserella marina]PWV73081.1 NADPH:quinone reductase-like Zn-dependent oxidoreductase [Prauserella marina]SDD72339.1 NADPH2:quinone reductase [Prauserella marina]
MKAILLKEHGEPEVLTFAEVPEPELGAGQVRIEVAYANITFVETQFRRSGWGPFSASLPLIPGNGVGGIITGIGEGADPALAGERVVSSLNGTGGYAERVVVDAAAVLPLPPALDLADAVALLADGRTAMMLHAGAGVGRGTRVLVEAAAGGVGSLLVQLARNAGATVVGAVGGAGKFDIVRELGADAVVGYGDAEWPRRVREVCAEVDVVFDAVGGDIGKAAFDLIGEGGRLVTFGAASGSVTEIPEELAAERGVSVGWGLGAPPEEMRQYAKSALALAAEGSLRPVIGQRFPLARAADAHAAMESRSTIGKTLLEVG